ncbi:MAG: phosphate ABC transporter ATP-binding protein [Deltaproteobacteria bacterium RBG_16_71_12]|nr:MAG: phosphate ABC transporter ATP-binding protein [Deltaproteobacteria bacterium RBG_16_71_12]
MPSLPVPPSTSPEEASTTVKLSVRGLDAGFGATRVVRGLTLDIPERQVLAIIGPSGCGKSTLVRCLNRMHELVPGATVGGAVLLDGHDIYARDVDPVLLRRRVGMVFQKPNPFPTMSIKDNVLAGLRLTGALRGGRARPRTDDVVEGALQRAALWDEVKDRLAAPGGSLSGGQQQRLCIARALAVEPEVLLMDEPCSALDPIATARIEDLIHVLRERYTIVIVTHNMQQAARASDLTAFLLHGELIECAPTERLFTQPSDRRTEDYITGKFG